MEAEGDRTSYVFDFYCCVTNYHTHRSLKVTHVLPHHSVGQKSGLSITGFSAQGLVRLKSRCELTVFSSGVEIQAHSGCWQNLTPCDYSPEVPVSLLSVGWLGVSLLVPRGCLQVPATCPFHNVIATFSKPAQDLSSVCYHGVLNNIIME